MLRNYLHTAWRNLLRHRFFSMINIFGLAMAMSICMGLIMLIADQLQYDRFNSNRETIRRVVTQHIEPSTGKVDEGQPINSTSPLPLKAALEKYTAVEEVVRFRRGFGNGWIEFENQDVNIPIGGYFADPGALQLMEYELQFGDTETALVEPYSVVLTRKAANKLFSDENPVGKTLKVGDLGLYVVTGVLKETTNKTHIAFDALASMSSLESLEKQNKMQAGFDDWQNYWNSWTYFRVKPGTSDEDMQQYLDKLYDNHIATLTNPDAIKMRFAMQKLTEITPGPFVNNPIGPSLPWLFVYILGGLAAVILVTSCFNFTNLSIARSLTRAREIGVRKVNGASRLQVFGQFIAEAVVISLIALVISVGLLTAVKPLILQLTFARIFRWDLASNMEVYAVFLVFAVFVGVLAGSFPAIVLSGFKPINVLKGTFNMKLFSRMGLRKALLVSQFTLSLVFILSVVVLNNQMNLFLNKDHGFEMKSQVAMKLNKTAAAPLKTELLKNANIVSVTAASHLPAAGTTYGETFGVTLAEPNWTNVHYYYVDESYLDNMELELKAGRFFRPDAEEENKHGIVINEATVQFYHFASAEEAIGRELIRKGDSTRFMIIGVVENYIHANMLSEIDPMALLYNPAQYGVVQVRYNGKMEDALATAKKAWAVVNPGLKADVDAMEPQVMLTYTTLFGDAVHILGFIAFLAIFISCLGLLGMATYATETRMKEISVRKILGGSNGSLVLLLSRGFIVILLVAIFIGAPIAYFLNNLWLELLPYHVSFDGLVIASGVGILLLFGIITVGSQTWRATFVNPVDNLKGE